MTTITEDYLKYHEEYNKKYNGKAYVLMQVGQFYESYATLERGPNLQEISNIIDVKCARKNNKKDINIHNPRMLGFQIMSYNKFVPKLIEAGYTVVIFDQVSDDDSIKRELTDIVSKGTYIDANNAMGNFIISIYFELVNQRKGNPSLCIGLSAVDITTGKTIVHEAYPSCDDSNLSLDDANRFISSINPKEMIIMYDRHNITNFDEIMKYLNINKNDVHIVDKVDYKYTKMNYQSEVLKVVYENYDNMLDPLEFTNLERCPFVIISLVYLCNFINDHNKQLIKDLHVPEFFMGNEHLILGNNAVYQLNVVESDSYNYYANSKFRSLIEVIDNASTLMGKRFIRDRLLSPMTNIEKIKVCHDYIDKIIDMKEDKRDKIEILLNGICDVERLCRKLCMNTIQPYELASLILSYDNALELFILLDKTKISSLVNRPIIGKLAELTKKLHDTMNIDKLQTQSINDIKASFFNFGIHDDIDKLQTKLNDESEYSGNLCEELINLLKIKGKTGLKINNNKREGYYISLTKQRANTLMEKFKNKETMKIGNITVNTKDFKLKNSGGNVMKLFFPSVEENDRKTIEEQIAVLIKKYYLELIGDVYRIYYNSLNEINKIIGHVDFLKSGAKTAKKYNYVKPIIEKRDYGYINAKNMRHPIVERIIDYEYVPHDIELGDKLKGMLIYGLNSSGKSVLMKAVGLNIILAQAGYFVSAENFIISPFKSLYTRITGNDNIFRGLSSFSLEMTELNAILKRAGKYTLTIGDEVCRGTEHISGTSIVASTLNKLSQAESSFIFATHLHDLCNVKRLKELDNIKAYHISVMCDNNTNTLIYDRKLKEGQGEPVYGVLVASHIIHDKQFIETANEIKNELLQVHNEIVSGKTSKYNSNVYVHKCQLCGRKDLNGEFSPLHTHHINFQKDCPDGFVKNKPHIKKNDIANLVVVCEDCHHKIHNGDINITGYVQTSKGKKINKN